MKFMFDNDLYSMESNSDAIISQINSYEMELYNIENEIKTNQLNVEALKSKFSDIELNLAGQLLNNINIQLVSLRNEIANIESQIALNSIKYGANHGSVIELNDRLKNIKNRDRKESESPPSKKELNLMIH